MRFFAALLCLLLAIACTPGAPPAEPTVEAPLIVEPILLEPILSEERVEPCVTGDGDGIGGTGCPVD
ncbi:hypothetical protein [uncultured Tateyamaria sp.]|uniref:hypothetical protein n=1 Tax=uncultured Tateyamaria sp. TaxID=455651 RepID=UPI00262BFF89|nr:hypothetical protein [uncultured Tateyamaria sp.]